jgi:hypothetical protein
MTRTAEIDAHLSETSYGYHVLCYNDDQYVGRFYRVRRDDDEDVKELYLAGEMMPDSD